MAITLGDAVWVIQTDLSQLNAGLARAQSVVQSSMGNILSAGKQIGLGMAAAGAVITGGLGVAIKTAADFEQEITNAASVTGKTGNEFQEARGKMADLAETLGQTTVFSAREAASAFYDLSSKGFDVAAMSVDQLKPILDLAAATQADLTTSTEISTSTLKGFELENSEMTRVADVMTLAIGSSAAKIELFGVSMPIVSASAKILNVSLEETTAALSTLYDRGIDSSTAATGLRNVMLDLADKTGPVAKALKEQYGVSIEDVDLKTRGLSGAMQYLESRGVSAENALSLFGKRSGTVAAKLIENSASVDGLTAKLKEAGGTAQTVAEQQLNTLNGQLKLLESAFEALVIPIGQALIPALTDLAKKLALIIQGIADFAKEHPNFMTAIVGITGGVGLLLVTLGPLIFTLSSLASTMIGANLAMAAGVPAFGTLGGVIAGIAAPIGIAVLALGVLAGAYWATREAALALIDAYDNFEAARIAEREAIQKEEAMTQEAMAQGFKTREEMMVAHRVKMLEQVQAQGAEQVAASGKVSAELVQRESDLIFAIERLHAQRGVEIPKLEAKLQDAMAATAAAGAEERASTEEKGQAQIVDAVAAGQEEIAFEYDKAAEKRREFDAEQHSEMMKAAEKAQEMLAKIGGAYADFADRAGEKLAKVIEVLRSFNESYQIVWNKTIEITKQAVINCESWFDRWATTAEKRADEVLAAVERAMAAAESLPGVNVSTGAAGASGGGESSGDVSNTNSVNVNVNVSGNSFNAQSSSDMNAIGKAIAAQVSLGLRARGVA